MRKRRKRIREDMIKKAVAVIIQLISLICLVVVVYVIGRTFIQESESHRDSARSTQVQETEQETEVKEPTVIEKTTDKSTEKETTKTETTTSTKTRVTVTTRKTTVTTEGTTEAEISTRYGPETNQDGNSVDWIFEQKNVIDLEKDGYDLRSKGTSGIQYVDPNGDVAKVLLQPEDSVNGKSYEEYYYQGNELIFAEIWNEDQDGLGEQYYFNNRVLIQWVDSDGIVHNRENGEDFAENSDWKKYLVAGQKAMRKSREGSSLSGEEDTSSSSAETDTSSSSSQTDTSSE